MKANHSISIVLFSLVSGSLVALAQSPPAALPNAPVVQLSMAVLVQAPPNTAPPSPATAKGTPMMLTRQDAEKIALANNPHIHISQLIAKAQHQVVENVAQTSFPI